MMQRNRRERGEGQFGCLVGLVILLVAILVAWKMIPIKVKSAELRDAIQDEARSAGTHRDPRILKTILDTAERLELPVTEDEITIRRANNIITIEVDYVVPVEFPGYTYEWEFNHKAENPIF
jgi:hypothetical protein